MDLTSSFPLCSLSAAKRLNAKRRRRPLARRLGSEYLEARLMLDATADFNAAIAAAQSLYATQQAGEDAAFQTTEQTDFDSLATQADGIGQGLLTDVTTDDQSLQSASDSAAGTMHTQDAASDQTDVTLDQNADDQAEQTIAQAVQDETNTDASDDAQLSSEVSAEQAATAATLNTNNNGFDNTMSADQAQTLANVTGDENAYNTTVSNDESQLEQTDASLESATAGQVSDLASSVVSQLGGIAPSVDPSVADSDAGYQAALAQGSDALNAAEQQAENDITNGDAAADAAAAPLFQAAADQFNTDTQGAQNNYNTNVQSAQDQYNQAILPFQQQLTNTLASDQQTYNTQVQTATNTFNGDMQTAGSDEATREAAADAAYNTSAQPLIDGYNTWLAGRSSQCQSDIATRQGQLATDLVGEDQTYNNTINGTASLPGLLPTEQSAIASANSTYAGQIATLNATRASEDAGVWNTFNSAVAGADQALAAAQNTYNQTVDQITNDAMQNNQPPDQSALNAAYNTLLAADHTHANSVASAAQALTSGLGADENEFVTNQKPYYVQKEDAIAAAEGAYEKGVAAAAKVRDDNDADHYASADADEATITSAYNDDVATHYETLQLSLAGFQSTRSDAYVDAQAQYADDAATAWQKEQKGIADAEQQQANDDAAAYENYDAQIIGPWQTMQNQLASAETQWAHDMAAAYASYATSMAAAQAQQVSGYESAYDTAVGDIEAGLNSYADIVSPALAAAVIAASGNDPNTTTWANAWASFNEQATALTASLMGQEAAQQDGVVGAVSAAYVGLVGQLNTESKNLEQQWGNGLVGLVSANVGAVAGYAGQVLPQALATQQDEINAARLEAGKEIDADAQDIRQHAANDDQDAKDHDAHTVAYAQAVLPVGLTTFIEVDDEVAKDAGTLEGDAAAFVKQMDGAAVTEVGNLVTDGEAMIHTEAGATCDYDIALTAQQVASANAAATANVTAVLNAPDSQFAGESFGGGMMFGDFTPTDPDSLMPDKDLPQPQGGFLSSFFSGVASFAQSLGQTVSDVLNGGAQLGQAALTLLANPTISWNDLLSSAGYLPGDYSIGAQSTSSGPVIVNSTAQLGVAFAMGNGLNWQFSQSNLLDSYANWFNSTFGSGYSNTVGNWIYDHMPVSDETLANAGDWQLFGATAAAATATVLGGYYLIPAAGSAIGSASSTIASMSWTPSIPYSFPAIFPTIGLDGTLAFTGISGVVSFTVTAADAAVVSAGSVLAYMVANGPIPNGPPDFSKNQDVLEARQLQQELNELIEAQTDAVESANHELAQWLQTAIEWTQQAISNLFK